MHARRPTAFAKILLLPQWPLRSREVPGGVRMARSIQGCGWRLGSPADGVGVAAESRNEPMHPEPAVVAWVGAATSWTVGRRRWGWCQSCGMAGRRGLDAVARTAQRPHGPWDGGGGWRQSCGMAGRCGLDAVARTAQRPHGPWDGGGAGASRAGWPGDAGWMRWREPRSDLMDRGRRRGWRHVRDWPGDAGWMRWRGARSDLMHRGRRWWGGEVGLMAGLVPRLPLSPALPRGGREKRLVRSARSSRPTPSRGRGRRGGRIAQPPHGPWTREAVGLGLWQASCRGSPSPRPSPSRGEGEAACAPARSSRPTPSRGRGRRGGRIAQRPLGRGGGGGVGRLG